MIFWNTAGLFNKEMGSWDYLGEMDFISLTEMWVDGRRWINLKNKLSDDFVWEFVTVSTIHKKGRAKGGFLFDMRKDWYSDDCRMVCEIDKAFILSEIRDE